MSIFFEHENPNRRRFLKRLAIALLGLMGLGRAGWVAAAPDGPGTAVTEKPAPLDWRPLSLQPAEWRTLVSPAAFAVLFEDGTERAGSSPLDREKRSGTYLCAACFLPLFTSETKFDSGTGWPSFYAPIEGRVGTSRDFKWILPRTEYHCARCQGHQGHIFKDGPRPTGLRYCNNGVALRFVPEGEGLPSLRSKT